MHPKRHNTRPQRRAAGGQPAGGFTMVEIVIVVLIIGILTAIMVPTMTRRAAEARTTAAKQDLQNLADAEERVSIDMGVFVKLNALDDVRGGDGRPNSSADDQIDGINDDLMSGLTSGIYESPQNVFINTSRQVFLQPGSDALLTLVTKIQNGPETPYDAGTLAWRGPYVNWKRDINYNDWPDDPWGNDYLMFFRGGGLFPPINGRDPNAVGGQLDYTEEIQEVSPYDTSVTINNLFDRPTILSLGPNGMPGDGSGATAQDNPEASYGRGDDIIVQFGGSSPF